MALTDHLRRVLEEYEGARHETFKSHPLASHLRDVVPASLRTVVPTDYLVKGSPGQGNWTQTPWVAVMDPFVTRTAQDGIYLVYLFEPAAEAVYLSLNQGTTVPRREHKKETRSVLSETAATLAAALDTQIDSDMRIGRLPLTGGTLSRDYAVANIAAIEYSMSGLAAGALAHDIARMLQLYTSCIEARDAMGEHAGIPDVQGDADDATGTEARSLRWHYRVERNRKLARDAKRILGSVCTVCDFRMRDRYGEAAGDYIEAHHITPFSEIQDRPTVLSVKKDFVVVCPNCHRMLHRRTPPYSVNELRAFLLPTRG